MFLVCINDIPQDIVSQVRLETEHDSDILQKDLKLPSNFIACRPKAALLFWFFGDFRCGVPLFIVILVIYKYKNR